MTSPTWPPPGPSRPSGPPNVPTPPGPPGLPGPLPSTPGAWGGAASIPQRPSTTRWLDAIVLAVASATVAGTLWWAVVGHSELQFVYGAIAVGFLVGWCTAIGARRPGIGPAAIAAVCTLVALVVSEYFIQRTIAVRDAYEVPLWQGFSFAEDVVRASIEDNGATALFWLLAAGAAAFTCFRQGQ
jgi:hypothetical protein